MVRYGTSSGANMFRTPVSLGQGSITAADCMSYSASDVTNFIPNFIIKESILS